MPYENMDMPPWMHGIAEMHIISRTALESSPFQRVKLRAGFSNTLIPQHVEQCTIEHIRKGGIEPRRDKRFSSVFKVRADRNLKNYDTTIL